ncbi:MAG: YcjF family protein, partial [Cyanobacteria bacterium P01_A01_bin.17]
AAAISGKMVMDLGSLYRLKFSVNQAQAIASTMASAMLKLGLVEISTQALSALLKGHAFTFVAGGLLQGVSAAHLTHVAGLSLTEHFQELNALELVSPESNWQPEKLKKTMERVFAAQQQLEGLKDFSQKAIGRFRRQGGLLESAT